MFLPSATPTCYPLVRLNAAESPVSRASQPPREIICVAKPELHTAAFLAFNHDFLRRFGADPHKISGLVGLSGTYVFVPDTDMLRAAFPPPYTARDWQPIRFVDASAPPTLLLHGLADREVLPQEAVELRDALKKAHVPVELDLFPHRGHADTVASFALATRWRTPALQDTVRFVRRVTGTASDSR